MAVIDSDVRTTTNAVDRVTDLVFERVPKWGLALAVVGVSVLIHGYGQAGSSSDAVRLASNPWTTHSTIDAPWTYSSPLGPMLAWLVRMNGWGGLHRFHFVLTIGIVLACTYIVGRCVSDLAGRLWALAFFCSPNAMASVAMLGLFDIFTVAAITAMFVGTPVIALGAGVVGGLAHFEQAAVAAVGITALRVYVRRESWRPIVAMWAGLLAGKVIVWAYVSYLGVDAASRLTFIREQGIGTLVDAWRGDVPTYLWAVFNVLWVGVIWMVADMPRRDRLITIATFAFLTLPVMITFDIGRVYRVITWPIVMLLVVYAAHHSDRTIVRRAALLIALAAMVVPRTEIWQHGEPPWIFY